MCIFVTFEINSVMKDFIMYSNREQTIFAKKSPFLSVNKANLVFDL